MKSNPMTTRLLRAIGSLRAVLVLASVALLAACGGGGEVVVAAPATAVSTTNLRVLPQEYLARKAVSYSPWRTGDREAERAALVNPVASAAFDANIKQDLDLLVAGNFRLIRLFDANDGPVDPGTGLAVEGMARRVLRIIDDNNLDIKVQLGGYINSVKYVLNPVVAADIRTKNQQELDRVVALATDLKYEDIILAVSVGNETMVVWSPVPVPPAEMAVHIKYVRDRVTQPVTTDDDFQFWREAPRVITDQIDFVAAHLYPLIFTKFPEGLFYYDWKQEGVAEGPARAEAMMNAAMAKGREVYQMVRDRMDRNGLTALPIAITEVGWNAVNVNQLGFRAHPVNQKMFYDRLSAFRAEGRVGVGPVNIFYFEAFDEPWKGNDDKWGLFNVHRQARYVIQNLNPPSATWVYEPGAYTDADAVYFIPLKKNPVVTASRYTVYADVAVPGAFDASSTLTFNSFGGNTAAVPELPGAAAPADGPNGIEITPIPQSYGWGVVRNLSNTLKAEDLSGFAGGTLHFSIRTTYAGKIEVGFSTGHADTTDAFDVWMPLSSGQYGYANDGQWHQVAIPIAHLIPFGAQAFGMNNSPDAVLDLSKVTNPFVIADRYDRTGKEQNSGITTKIQIDAIFWTKP